MSHHLFNKDYSVLDIETTGLNARQDEITMIAIYRYRDYCLVDKYVGYVKVKQILNPFIVAKTKITNEYLNKHGKDIVDVLRDVKEFIRDSFLVAHNGFSFDLHFINTWLRKLNLGEIKEKSIDTLVISKRLFPSVRSHTLKNLCLISRIEFNEDKAHNAVYDVEKLWELFSKSLEPALKHALTINDGLLDKVVR